MKGNERISKRRKTELDRNFSLMTSSSDEGDTSFEETSSSRHSSFDNTDEEYVPLGGTGNLSPQQYCPAASKQDTSTSGYRPASGSSCSSSTREYFSGDKSNSSSDESHTSSQIQYSDQDDVATEIVGSLSPDEYRTGLVSQSICNQEYSSSAVNKAIKRINELKRSLPNSSGKSTAAYVTQTFELRGTITTVAEQLSTSRQMEKSLKSRLKNTVAEIDFLRQDKQLLRRDLQDATEALKRADKLLAVKDDIINSKEMELFIIRNDLELSKRSQLKAETEKKQLEMVLNARNQYYESMKFDFQQAFPNLRGPVPRPRVASPAVFPANPQRYKYYAPNYKFNKPATATEANQFSVELSKSSHFSNNGKNFGKEEQYRQSPVGQKELGTFNYKDMNNTHSQMNSESELTASGIQMDSLPSSVVSQTEDEDCSTSRADSPVELIISAEDDDFDEESGTKERFRYR